ncbi:MAG TPA: hypothetical protein DCE65_02790 [Clostridiales bacterium]|nr:hypothetical protein [Clostridiales bacterium]
MYSLLTFSDIMKNAGGVLAAVAVLLAMVTIHEFGHYLAGKILGFKINEFSVGFGPAIFKKRSKKTGELFALRVVPLGGYCAFDGEDEADEETEKSPEDKKNAADEPFSEMAETGESGEKAGSLRAEEIAEENQAQSGKESESDYPEPKGIRFNDQPPWKRIIVLLAGATMNYLLGLLLIFVMFVSVGRPMYSVVKEKPDKNEEAAANGVRSSLFLDTQDGEAEENGLCTGDVIVRIEGKKVYLISDYLSALKGKNAGDTAKIEVLREENGERVSRIVEVTLAVSSSEFDALTKTGYMVRSLGVYALAPVTQREGFGRAAGDSFAYSFKEAGMVLSSLGQLITGKIPLKSMGGPITTIRITSQQATSGWLSFLNIASFIGVNLAVFNLLPIPALDGSKIVFCIIEWIRKKPINRKVEAMIHFIGIIVLFGFAILVDFLQFL